MRVVIRDCEHHAIVGITVFIVNCLIIKKTLLEQSKMFQS